MVFVDWISREAVVDSVASLVVADLHTYWYQTDLVLGQFGKHSVMKNGEYMIYCVLHNLRVV